jgi:hypothetical protein
VSLAPQRRVAFLFNHEHIHQIAHAGPVAFELSRRHPQLAVELLASSTQQLAALAELAARFPGQRCAVRAIGEGPRSARVAALGRWFAPLRKLAVLRDNAQSFATFDAIVVPEKTSLRIRRLPGCAHVKLIHTRHGAGDREIGFDAASREFDLVLVSGEKIRRRLADAGTLAPRHAVVGYPKFDAVAPLASARPRLFSNDRPTVLYNPHCSPHLSSWYAMGREILEFFRHSDAYNLIFAPHVMMFRRRLQVSVDKLAVAWVRCVPREYFALSHVRIDLGSPACTDMTYTRAADVYLGDVSSQVCEFLAEPRPCVFANARGVAWRDDPSYAAWRLGPVIERAEELPRALESAVRGHGALRAAQEAYVRDTFDLSPVPPSRRAADAIEQFVTSLPSPGPSGALREIPRVAAEGRLAPADAATRAEAQSC